MRSFLEDAAPDHLARQKNRLLSFSQPKRDENMGRSMWADFSDEHAQHALGLEVGRHQINVIRDAIATGRFGALTDVIGQYYRGWAGGWTDGEVLAFGQVVNLYNRGELTWLSVPISYTPSLDKEWKENQEKLQALPSGLRATVYESAPRDEDGRVVWVNQPPLAWPGFFNSSPYRRHGHCQGAPLEIGHTNASTTIARLIMWGALARWPYGHTRLWILCATEKWRIPVQRLMMCKDCQEYSKSEEAQNRSWEALQELLRSHNDSD